MQEITASVRLQECRNTSHQRQVSMCALCKCHQGCINRTVLFNIPAGFSPQKVFTCSLSWYFHILYCIKGPQKIYELSTGALSHCSGKNNAKDACRVHSSVSFCPRVSYKIHSDLTSRRPLIPGLSFLRILSSQI